MLTIEQRRSVVRALKLAYNAHKDLPLLQVCRKHRIRLLSNPKDGMSGGYETFPDPIESPKNSFLSGGTETASQKKIRLRWNDILRKYRHQISIPGKRETPPDYKEHVFWHEFCHFILGPLRLMPRFIGYQGARQKYGQFAEDYWAQERLCEAFADVMLLYRRGIIARIRPNFEAFLFEDQTSIGYAEVAGFSLKRVRLFLDKAKAEQRNVDLRNLRGLLAHQERFVAIAGFQPELPMDYFDSHREPLHYVETGEPDPESLHRGKDSWAKRLPEETRIVERINALRYETEHPQLAFFEELELDRRRRFKKELKLVDRAAKRFQNNKSRH